MTEEIIPSTDLVVVEALVPTVVFAPGGVRTVLDKLKADVRAIKRDISTPKGRAAVKSLAFKVARSKTALDAMGKDLVADLKVQTNAIDAERRVIRDELDELKIEVMAEHDAWEASEEKRIATHQSALDEIADLANPFSPDLSSDEVGVRLKRLDEIALDGRDWQEFVHRAVEVGKAARERLNALLADAQKREAEAAETVRLAAEQEAERLAELARQQAEREAEIARQAAETARLEAEETAENARLAVEKERMRIEYIQSLLRHIVDCGNGLIYGDSYPYGVLFHELEEKVVIDDSFGEFRDEAIAARETALAKLRAGLERQAEADRKAETELQALAKAERDRKAAEDRATEIENRRILESEMAETSRLAAERQKEREIEAARVAEREAAAKETKRLQDEADERARNKERQRVVNGEVKADLIALGLTDALAVAVIKAVVKGEVRNVAIRY